MGEKTDTVLFHVATPTGVRTIRGASIDVVDGHLCIYTANDAPAAFYAPSGWSACECDAQRSKTDAA